MGKPLTSGRGPLLSLANDLGEIWEALGGYGSGWQGSKKATVEDGLTLDIKRLVEEWVIALGGTRRGIFDVELFRTRTSRPDFV